MKLGNLLSDGVDATTFMGLAACTDIATLDADIAVIGVPIATPYPAFGSYAAGAPAAIRAGVADFAGSRAHVDFDFGGPPLADARVVDCGDVPGDAQDTAGNRQRITGAIATILDRGATPVVIGGDDSVPIPVFQAFAGRGRYTVLQVDAHIDWRDEVKGERMGLSSTMRRASEMGHVERIVQVGARGIGSARPADLAAARAFGVDFVFADAVHEHGIGPVLDLIAPGSEVLVSIDCDGLDPGVIPAVIGPAPGGLSYWQTVKLLRGVAARARMACFDIVEFMPARDINGLGALAAGRLVINALGLIARSRTGNRGGTA